MFIAPNPRGLREYGPLRSRKNEADILPVMQNSNHVKRFVGGLVVDANAREPGNRPRSYVLQTRIPETAVGSDHRMMQELGGRLADGVPESRRGLWSVTIDEVVAELADDINGRRLEK